VSRCDPLKKKNNGGRGRTIEKPAVVPQTQSDTTNLGGLGGSSGGGGGCKVVCCGPLDIKERKNEGSEKAMVIQLSQNLEKISHLSFGGWVHLVLLCLRKPTLKKKKLRDLEEELGGRVYRPPRRPFGQEKLV